MPRDLLENKQPVDLLEKKAQPNIIEQVVQGPGRDLAAGLLKGNIAVSKPSASVLEFLRTPERFNIPKQVIGDAETLLQNLPPPTSGQPAKAINELIGQVPGITGEFLQGGTVLKGLGVTGALAKTITGKALIPASELA